MRVIDESAFRMFADWAQKKGLEQACTNVQALGIPTKQVDALRAEYVARAKRKQEARVPPILVNRGIESWYIGPGEDDTFWPSLKLDLHAAGWEKSNINDLDEASDVILAHLPFPRTDRYSSRGLVVGYVQSGKTTNYTAVIAKAADQGFRLFIVLSGIHNSLRRQTQERLTKQLVEVQPQHWFGLTKPLRDFNPPTEDARPYLAEHTNQHILCVAKKNAPVLRKLVAWLNTAKFDQTLFTCPAIIVDDEADQASVATRTINPLIRELLDLLPKSVYIGYTATPFANVLIDPSADDLYPRDFILSLKKPAGHFGTESIFGRHAVEGADPDPLPLDGYDMVRQVPATEISQLRPASRKAAETFEPELTSSLQEAIQYFWLATAARRYRGTGNQHSTMLIHTTLNAKVHEAFKDPILAERKRTLRLLQAQNSGFLEELKDLWVTEHRKVSSSTFQEKEVPFDGIALHLPEVVESTSIIVDNYRSDDRLDYTKGPVTAIAVGGNTLSRGLTLEGLVVSFFVRAASAYDTLLQMGRWFGYRDGYADLPRIWMTDELRDWFRHIATVEYEIRLDIDRYRVEDLTPTQFAVRIRTHPELAITQAAKMADAQRAEASYGGRRIQTRYFKEKDADWLQSNLEAAQNLVSHASATTSNVLSKAPGYVLFEGVSYEEVLDFLSKYRVHEKSVDMKTDLVSRYIQKQVNRDVPRLRRWTVGVMGSKPNWEDEHDVELAPGHRVGVIQRSKLKGSDGLTADIKTLMSKEDLVVDLDVPRARDLPEAKLREIRLERVPDSGLLLLYPIDKASKPDPSNEGSRDPLHAEVHLIGLAMVFPGSGDRSEAVEYVQAPIDRLAAESVEEPDEEALTTDTESAA
jgi:hypothetical protein